MDTKRQEELLALSKGAATIIDRQKRELEGYLKRIEKLQLELGRNNYLGLGSLNAAYDSGRYKLLRELSAAGFSGDLQDRNGSTCRLLGDGTISQSFHIGIPAETSAEKQFKAQVTDLKAQMEQEISVLREAIKRGSQ